MASKVEVSTTPPEVYNIYMPAYAESGELVALALVEAYEIRPSDVAPPLGARMAELEYLTGTAHLSELVEIADTPKGWAAKAVAGQEAIAAAATEGAAQEQAASDAKQVAAKDRIAQLLDPEGYAKAQAEAAIVADHDALIPFASNAEKSQLNTVKAARLAELN